MSGIANTDQATAKDGHERGQGPRRHRLRGVPRTVWMFGLVSLCMDASSELIASLLPAFLALELGVGALALGVVEGSAEAIASLTKVVSGRVSDRFGRRKPLAVMGYGLSALTKPLFALAPGLGVVLLARGVDRLGKGIRGAPRDAMIADVTPREVRGAAYGLRQALDTVGAVLGPLLAMGWMIHSGGQIRQAFAIAIIPAVLAVVILVLGVRESASNMPKSKAHIMDWGQIRDLGAPIWRVLGLAGCLTLARLTEAFLLLAVLHRGVEVRYSPLTMVVMSAVYAAAAYPAGKLADRVPRLRLYLLAGVLLVAAHSLMALANTVAGTMAGVALYGMHMAASQGLLSAWVADRAPNHARGTAFGMLHFVTGIGTLAAGVLAGLAWDWRGPGAAFGLGAALAVVATLGGLWIGDGAVRSEVR